MPTNTGWDVVVVGGINTDYLIRGEKMPRPGETVEGEVFLQGPGGKGANQAVGAARLGARVSIVGRVGHGLRGEDMIHGLEEEGVDTQYITRDEHGETGAAVIAVDHSGEKAILTAPGVNLNVRVYDILKAEPVIRSSRVLVTQFEVPVGAAAEALRIARANGVRTILDPAPPRRIERAVLEAMLKDVDVIKPNQSEAEALTGIKVKDRSSARAAAKRLISAGVKAVAIPAGSDGNLLVWGDGEYWMPRIPVETVDATGAGDAFTGALAFELARGQSLMEAARVGNAAAAFATTRVGAQAGLPRPEDIEAVLRKAAA